jgi:hypothetical protein
MYLKVLSSIIGTEIKVAFPIVSQSVHEVVQQQR